MNDATDLSPEQNAEEILGSELSDDALEAAAETVPINKSTLLSTFNGPSAFCC